MSDGCSEADCDADCEPLTVAELQALGDGVALGDSEPEPVRHAVGENDSVAVAVEHTDCVGDTDRETECDLVREPLGVLLPQPQGVGEVDAVWVTEREPHCVGEVLVESVPEDVEHGVSDPLVVEVIEDEMVWLSVRDWVGDCEMEREPLGVAEPQPQGLGEALAVRDEDAQCVALRVAQAVGVAESKGDCVDWTPLPAPCE